MKIKVDSEIVKTQTENIDDILENYFPLAIQYCEEAIAGITTYWKGFDANNFRLKSTSYLDEIKKLKETIELCNEEIKDYINDFENIDEEYNRDINLS